MAPEGNHRVSIGVPALDEILNGGLIQGSSYLVRGAPGTGKTLLGLHFLAQGVRRGEPALFVALSEPPARVRANAAAVGIDMTGIEVLDLTPGPELFAEEKSYDIFTPAEVERGPVTRHLVACVNELKPRRVVLDAITQLRYLSMDEQAFRRQIFSLLRYLTEEGATVLYTSEYSDELADTDLQFMSDGIIRLARAEDRRTVSVLKSRGSGFQPGSHELLISKEGLQVFPRLLRSEEPLVFTPELLSTGLPNLDQMLGGGLERGMVTLINGPLGIGKTTLAMQIMLAAAQRGETGAAYLFDETVETVRYRLRAMGLPIDAMMAEGNLRVRTVEPLRVSADQFAQQVRREVEEHETELVMVDSLLGYRLALRGQDLAESLHALSRYLRAVGVTVLLTNETDVGPEPIQTTGTSFSYLMDVGLVLRYYEMGGELRRGIGVLKKRLSRFETTFRSFALDASGIRVGDPLGPIAGYLYGVPNVDVLSGQGKSDD